MVTGFARTSSNALVAPTKSSSAESPSASKAMSAMAISSRKRKAYDMGLLRGMALPAQREKAGGGHGTAGYWSSNAFEKFVRFLHPSPVTSTMSSIRTAPSPG